MKERYKASATGGTGEESESRFSIFGFLRIYFRKFHRFLIINLIYFIITLPMLTFVCIEVNMAYMSSQGGEGYTVFPGAMLFAPLFSSLPGGVNYFLLALSVALYGPAKMGMTFVFRGMASERHVWLSDFFTEALKNWKLGLFFGLFDAAVIGAGLSYAVAVIITAMEDTGGITGLVLVLLVLLAVFYFNMRKYFYLQAVSVELGAFAIFKNAFFLSFLSFGKNMLSCVLCLLIWCAATALDIRITIAVVPTLAWSLPGFVSVYTGNPAIQKYLIEPSIEAMRDRGT